MASGNSGYWFPSRVLHVGHPPVWCWLFPPFWLVLVPAYAVWLVAVLVWFVISLPVNLVRATTHHEAAIPPIPPRFDTQTGEHLPPRYDVHTGKRL